MMKIGVLMGGISTEREISLKSGNSALEHLDKNKYEIIPIVIDKKEDIFTKTKGIDFALLALHGKFGEDGTVQSILQTLDIPYSGCGPLSSSMCMNKNITKQILKANNIRTAKWINVTSVEKIDFNMVRAMNYPLFVKPTNGGSSVATFKVYNEDDLINSVKEALKYDKEVLIEEFIEGKEITCPVFDGKLYPLVAINPTSDFFDFTQKYSNIGADEYIINFEEDLYKEIEKMALGTYNALNCDVYSRIDMIITSDGTPYLLEVNTLPGMTATSLFPKSMQEAGISYPEFLDKIINTSLTVSR